MVFSADKFFENKIVTIQFLLSMFQRQFQVCLLVQKGPKFHNIGTNDVSCTVGPSINMKDKVWPTVLV